MCPTTTSASITHKDTNCRKAISLGERIYDEHYGAIEVLLLLLLLLTHRHTPRDIAETRDSAVWTTFKSSHCRRRQNHKTCHAQQHRVVFTTDTTQKDTILQMRVHVAYVQKICDVGIEFKVNS